MSLVDEILAAGVRPHGAVGDPGGAPGRPSPSSGSSRRLSPPGGSPWPACTAAGFPVFPLPRAQPSPSIMDSWTRCAKRNYSPPAACCSIANSRPRSCGSSRSRACGPRGGARRCRPTRTARSTTPRSARERSASSRPGAPTVCCWSTSRAVPGADRPRRRRRPPAGRTRPARARRAPRPAPRAPPRPGTPRPGRTPASRAEACVSGSISTTPGRSPSRR